jgi:homoserine O-acetyltransferase/O-succinyltransferase
VLAINWPGGERNPPEQGLLKRAVQRIPGAQAYVNPCSPDTFGHGTTGQARW